MEYDELGEIREPSRELREDRLLCPTLELMVGVGARAHACTGPCFDGRPIRFADAIVRPIVAEDSSYQFVVEQEGFEPVTMKVSGVIGGGHMYGGGTQGFVSEFPDGTVRFLPFDFIKREDVWFCNTRADSKQCTPTCLRCWRYRERGCQPEQPVHGDRSHSPQSPSW